MNRKYGWPAAAVLGAVLLWGCGGQPQPQEPLVAPGQDNSPPAGSRGDGAPSGDPQAESPEQSEIPRDPETQDRPAVPPPKPAPPADPEIEAQARQLIEQGRELYRRGAYDQAEKVLKEALTLYPFLPNANLILGKIFLIRGSAERDLAMVNSAKLMFEMALALDPQLREAGVLLELFLAAPLE